jgi:hypothetical protein
MSWIDLLWFPPLMLAIAIVVGGAGRERGEVGPAVWRTFFALASAVVVVALVVRLLVQLMA